MPPKKRNTESKGKSQTKRRKKQNDVIEEFEEDSGGELDNTNNGTETDETYDVVSLLLDDNIIELLCVPSFAHCNKLVLL